MTELLDFYMVPDAVVVSYWLWFPMVFLSCSFAGGFVGWVIGKALS